MAYRICKHPGQGVCPAWVFKPVVMEHKDLIQWCEGKILDTSECIEDVANFGMVSKLLHNLSPATFALIVRGENMCAVTGTQLKALQRLHYALECCKEENLI